MPLPPYRRAAVSPPTGSMVERPQRSEDERPWDRQGLMQDRSGGGTVAGIDGLLRAGVEVGGSSIASNRWPWAARGARVPVIPSPRQAAWSCTATAGRAQSNGRPRRQAGVMTHTSTRRAAPEPFTSPAWVPEPGSAPGRRAGRNRPVSAAYGRRRRGRCRCPAGRRCGESRRPACCL
jgi:hypothetical protein